MSWDSDIFVCIYCGKKFQSAPIKLALHIKNDHENSRGKLANLANDQAKTIEKL